MHGGIFRSQTLTAAFFGFLQYHSAGRPEGKQITTIQRPGLSVPVVLTGHGMGFSAEVTAEDWLSRSEGRTVNARAFVRCDTAECG